MTNSRMPQKVLATLAFGLLPVIAMADGNWLVGGGLGTAQARESFDGVRWEPSSTSYGIYGGYQFNDYFALQAGYLDLGSFDDSIVIDGTSINIAGDVDGFTAAAVARVPFGQRFDAHAKLGWYSYDATASYSAEVRDPGYTLPRALGWGVVFMMSGYMLPMLVAIVATDSEPEDWVAG